jgi:hypothetical protein
MGEDIKGGGRERVRVIEVERLLFASLWIVMRGAGIQKKVNQRTQCAISITWELDGCRVVGI